MVVTMAVATDLTTVAYLEGHLVEATVAEKVGKLAARSAASKAGSWENSAGSTVAPMVDTKEACSVVAKALLRAAGMASTTVA